MRITEQSRQALHILLALARATPNAATASQVAEAVGLPETTIFKVLKTLTRAGLVATVRGRGGGIWLARPADVISLGDVLRACEPRFVQCGPAAHPMSEADSRARTGVLIAHALGGGLAAFVGEGDRGTLSRFCGRPGSGLPQSVAVYGLDSRQRRHWPPVAMAI